MNTNTVNEIVQNTGGPTSLTNPTANTTTLFVQNANTAANVVLQAPIADVRLANGESLKNSALSGRGFIVRMVGNYTLATNAATNVFTPAIFFSTNTTGVASTAIATTSVNGSTTGGTPTSGNFIIEAECTWDANSQVLTCFSYGAVGANPAGTGGAVALAGTVSQITGVATSQSNLVFVPTAKFLTASATNVAQLTEFSIELL